jgi:hypothetical protein
VTTRIGPRFIGPFRDALCVRSQVMGPETGPALHPRGRRKASRSSPRTASDPRPHRRSLDPGSMVPDVAVSFLETHTGSQRRRAAAAERALRSAAQPRGWCPVSLEFLARLRPAGRTETLTEAITPRQYR